MRARANKKTADVRGVAVVLFLHVGCGGMVVGGATGDAGGELLADGGAGDAAVGDLSIAGDGGGSQGAPDFSGVSFGAMTPPAVSPDGGVTCVGQVLSPPASPTKVSGVIAEWADDDGVYAGATIEYFATATQLGQHAPVATAKSDANGRFEVTLPGGVARFIRTSRGGTRPDWQSVAQVEVVEWNVPWNNARATALWEDSHFANYGLLSITPESGRATIFGRAFDCSGVPLSNAQANVISGAFDAVKQKGLFYYTRVGGSDLPSRVQHWTSVNGLFFAANVPPGAFDALLAVVPPGGVGRQVQSWVRGTIAADQVVVVHLSLGDAVP